MDGVEVEEGAVIQNSVVGVGAKLGKNCNLQQCIVHANASVAANAKHVKAVIKF